MINLLAILSKAQRNSIVDNGIRFGVDCRWEYSYNSKGVIHETGEILGSGPGVWALGVAVEFRAGYDVQRGQGQEADAADAAGRYRPGAGRADDERNGQVRHKCAGGVLEEYKKEFTAEKMNSIIVPIYAKYFTAKELDDVISFYESETGRRGRFGAAPVDGGNLTGGAGFAIQAGQRVMEKLKEKGKSGGLSSATLLH